MAISNETSSDARPYVVVAALAFDETGDAALNEAVRVGAGVGCELHLLHVVHEGPHATTKAELRSVEKHLNEATEALRRKLDKHVIQQPVICHVRFGDVTHSILQMAVDLTADMLIVGSHRRKAVTQLLLGSVAREVVDSAHCPVLVALPKDYSGLIMSDIMAPPCPDCLDVRKQTNHETFWCKRHQHAYHKPHVYAPTESGRPVSVIPGSH
ncbi:MAG TPA: universal stress protein [Polyangiales bacterium]|nr:universal stress protein [Polyangiales bacterium]